MSAAAAATGTESAATASTGTLSAMAAEAIGTPLYPSTTLYPSATLYPRDPLRGFIAATVDTGSLTPA